LLEVVILPKRIGNKWVEEPTPKPKAKKAKAKKSSDSDGKVEESKSD
jgi:hypothetical protein